MSRRIKNVSSVQKSMTVVWSCYSEKEISVFLPSEFNDSIHQVKHCSTHVSSNHFVSFLPDDLRSLMSSPLRLKKK